MYVERQMGGQCRRHALNAFFGGALVNWGDIESYSKDFEQFYNLPTTNQMKNDYDFFNADGSSLLTWVAQTLDPDHFFLVVPCGHIQKWKDYMRIEDLDTILQPAFMLFRPDHVYAMRKKDNTWYVLDSLNPRPYAQNLRTVTNDTNLGMVVSLNQDEVANAAFRLEQNISTFLNRFPGLHTETVKTFLEQGTLGDAGDMLEIWSQTRLRMLSFLRAATSTTSRVYRHVRTIHLYPDEKEENKKILAYSVLLS